MNRRDFLKLAASSIVAAALPQDSQSNGTLDARILSLFDERVWDRKILSGISKDRDGIIAAAKKAGISPIMLASVQYSEAATQSKLDDLSDCIKAILPSYLLRKIHQKPPTIGPYQVSVRTADAVLGNNYRKMNNAQFKAYQNQLFDVNYNREIAAEYLFRLIYRTHRAGFRPNQELMKDMHLLAVVFTEYKRGPTANSLGRALPRDYGYLALSRIAREGPLNKIINDPYAPPTDQIKQYIKGHKNQFFQSISRVGREAEWNGRYLASAGLALGSGIYWSKSQN